MDFYQPIIELLFCAPVLFGMIAYPLSAMIIARKTNHNPYIAMGIGLLPHIVLAVTYPIWWPLILFVTAGWIVLGAVLYLVALRWPDHSNPVEHKEHEITLAMPYPPGTRDWGDKQ